VRVATWNMKQAFPRRGTTVPGLWDWVTEALAPDVVVLTEARVPRDGPPGRWRAVWDEGGVGPRRRWGTVVAGRGVNVARVDHVTLGRFRRRSVPLSPRVPGTAVVADVTVDGDRWATVVGLYGLTVDLDGTSVGHGRIMVPALLDDLAPLLRSDRGDRVIVAGDFNLWPCDMPPVVEELGLVDLTAATSADRPALEGCRGCDAPTAEACGHLWTHRNGDSPNAARQQIDFILATPALRGELTAVSGGIGDHPDAWDLSDHAPVVADFAT